MYNLKVIENKGERVLTTEQLAQVYGVEEVRIRQGFSRNQERFEEGKHYYRLIGEELKEFKAKYLKDTNLKFVSELLLWTERGANRYCKILDTDKAWEQFDNLEETYFRTKETKQVPMSIEDMFIQQLKEQKLLKNRVGTIEYKLDSLEISPFQRKQLMNLRNKRVIELLGGKKSEAYKDSSFRSKVYADLSRQFNRYFDIPGYEWTPKNRFEEAQRLIRGYNLSMELNLELDNINRQIAM